VARLTEADVLVALDVLEDGGVSAELESWAWAVLTLVLPEPPPGPGLYPLSWSEVSSSSSANRHALCSRSTSFRTLVATTWARSMTSGKTHSGAGQR
jgi:hypothetical protein